MCGTACWVCAGCRGAAGVGRSSPGGIRGLAAIWPGAPLHGAHSGREVPGADLGGVPSLACPAGKRACHEDARQRRCTQTAPTPLHRTACPVRRGTPSGLPPACAQVVFEVNADALVEVTNATGAYAGPRSIPNEAMFLVMNFGERRLPDRAGM